MQGQGSSISSIPENINFDRGSASGDSTLEPQMSWNSMQTSAQNRLPEYMLSSGETTIQYLHHVRRDGPNAEWGLGETSDSSSQHQGDQNERKKEHSWTFPPQATVERPYEESNIVSLDTDDESPNVNQTTNGSFVLRNSSPALPQDLNMVSGFIDEEDDECQLVEYPSSSYLPIGPSNEQMRLMGSSSASFSIDAREDRPGCSADGRRMSCKRKALEVHTGQSSGVGSSRSYQNEERSQWHTIPAAQVAMSEANMPAPRGEIVINDSSEQTNPRLRLGVGAAVPPTPFSLTSSGNAEISRRNFRLRSINGLYQQDPIPEIPFSTETDVGNVNVPTSQYSSRLIRNRLDLNPAPPLENGSLHVQGVLNIPSITPSVRRHHHHSRWSGASSTRSSRSSASAVSEERPFGESSSRNIPRSISEHPMFVAASEIGTSSHNATNWNLHGENNTIAGNVASTSRVGPNTGTNSSAPGWSHRNYPQYPRRLSEMVRRSLLSSAGAEPGGQSSNHAIRSPSPALSQETAHLSGSESHGHRLLSSRSALLDRHLDGSFGIPHSLRTLAAAGEGRTSASIMSEVYRILLSSALSLFETLLIFTVLCLHKGIIFMDNFYLLFVTWIQVYHVYVIYIHVLHVD
ncbi:hypothetical protein ACS0TY_013243 [Phlomoides rotata]